MFTYCPSLVVYLQQNKAYYNCYENFEVASSHLSFHFK